MLEVRLLGPFTVSADDRPLALTATRQRLLLARLAVAAGRPVQVDQLIDDLWGDEPPSSAMNIVQVQVSALRRALGPDAIVTDGRAYRLGPGFVTDLVQFRHEVSSGLAASDASDAVAATSWLSRALGRWTGSPMIGLDFGSAAFVEGIRTELIDLRVQALEAWAILRIRGGHAAEVATTLHPITSEYPYREALRAQLMLAMASAGRQVEALAEYDRARVELADEFGVDPGAELQAAHTAVLLNDLPDVRPLVPSLIRLGLQEPVGRIVGRQADLTSLLELCGQRDVRLVTVLGPGGVGKTRLAQEAIAQASTDGAFVSLTAAERADDVAATIGAALTIELGTDPEQALIRILNAHPRELLLVLDNAEHVLDAAPLVGRLVQSVSSLTVLATSREPLRLAGEHRVLLDPLSVESSGDGPSPAAALLLDRMRTHDARFTPTDEQLQDATAIAELCDGLPLAIEIAAARTSVYSLGELRGRLAQPLSVLVAPGNASGRGSSVRASISWSVAGLPDQTMAVLNAATVFRGGFTAAALAEVARLDSETAVSHLHVLIERSLVRPLANTGPQRRFDLLQIVREVVSESLDAQAMGALRDRHVFYHRKFLGPVPDARVSPDTQAQLDEIAGERANLRAAVRHAASMNTTVLAELIVSLGSPWSRLGPINEIGSWLAELLTRPDLDDAARLDCLIHSLRVNDRTGEADVRTLLAQAWALPLADHDPSRKGALVAYELIDVLNGGQHEDPGYQNFPWRDLQDSSPTTFYSSSMVRTMQGVLAGNYDDATQALSELRDWATAHNFELIRTNATHNLCEMLLLTERFRETADVALHELDLVAKSDLDSRAGLLGSHGTALLYLGDIAGAVAALETALSLYIPFGATRAGLEALMRLAAARAARQPDDYLAPYLVGVWRASFDEIGIRGQPVEERLLEDFLGNIFHADKDSYSARRISEGADLVHRHGPAVALRRTADIVDHWAP